MTILSTQSTQTSSSANVAKQLVSSQKPDIPHCSNPVCSNFHPPDKETRWFTYFGSYHTKVAGKVHRYQCKCCGKTFSYRTFSIDYYTKKNVDYHAIFNHLVTSTGGGNVCRLQNLTEAILLNRYQRLSRSLLGLHSVIRDELTKDECESKLVLDGFESFSHSQYHPNNINILVGSSHEFIYGMGLSILKRKGRMTKKQRAKRDELELLHKTNPKETLMSVYKLLSDSIIQMDLNKKIRGGKNQKMILITDMHKTYPRSLALADPDNQYFTHVQISSELMRTVLNPLFPVNYADRQFRKDLANHVRETVQFSRCPSAMMARLTLYQVYHNCISPYRVKEYRKGNRRGRVQCMGVSKQRMKQLFDEFWGKRIFHHKLRLWDSEEKTWFMQWRNPGVKMTRYIPKYISV